MTEMTGWPYLACVLVCSFGLATSGPKSAMHSYLLGMHSENLVPSSQKCLLSTEMWKLNNKDFCLIFKTESYY